MIVSLFFRTLSTFFYRHLPPWLTTKGAHLVLVENSAVCMPCPPIIFDLRTKTASAIFAASSYQPKGLCEFTNGFIQIFDLMCADIVIKGFTKRTMFNVTKGFTLESGLTSVRPAAWPSRSLRICTNTNVFIRVNVPSFANFARRRSLKAMTSSGMCGSTLERSLMNAKLAAKLSPKQLTCTSMKKFIRVKDFISVKFAFKVLPMSVC